MRHASFITLLAVILAGSCKNEPDKAVEILEITSLPMLPLSLEDLSGFQPTTDNWSIAGRVYGDFNLAQDLNLEAGAGVLVNKSKESENGHIFTAWDHGDLEISLEFMIPKSSNSGIYFQGRYEIQLFDSWKVTVPQHSDCGGIYQRWNDQAAEGAQGFEGHAPAINAALAPGLWQRLYVKFRAPRFDAEGNKIANARFDEVKLNNRVLHKHVEVTGPTRASEWPDEVPTAPLMIQGDHGNVAFRNISYKRYFNEKVRLSSLNYNYYEMEMLAGLPDFDSMVAVSEGAIDSFNIDQVAQRDNFFGIRFQGKMALPVSGTYVFHTISDDGTKFYVDNKLVVSNDFNHSMERQSGGIELAAGPHDIRLDYFNNQWGKGLAVFYEGPEMAYQPLNSLYENKQESIVESLLLDPGEQHEMLRGFVNYQNEKRTHVISVGSPQGVHYSLDLKSGALLKTWRGGFADVTNMWVGRGHSQLIIPQSIAVELSDGPPVANLNEQHDNYEISQDDFKLAGYELDMQGAPTFEYSIQGAQVLDNYKFSTDDQLDRQLQIDPGGNESLHCRLGAADYILLMENGWYTIGGRYYLKFEEKDIVPVIRNQAEQMELLVPISRVSTVNYSVLW